ncbi:hypothetical protein N7G274_009740 [Stereocaulon virgatum]|uniref:MYND-type domain-containing protein n=1 Tax=Stereocaulon virgatum TaxID=373712 RepID=A0ABR3ZV25_9LECA
MATSTKLAVFQFQIINGDQKTTIEHTHPVPTFLCTPTPSQKGSQAFRQAFIDVVSIITNQHHDECMHAITTPCVGCGSPAKDALKLPASYLNLVEPMLVVRVTPVCGNKNCDYNVRKQVLEAQSKILRQGKEHESRMYENMDCNNCGRKEAKRCAGCRMVAYCGQECQKVDWKGHKKACGRKKLGEPSIDAGLPCEQI